ncbi:hypothetical protein DACRYDRAFT_109242 [Dacryopinax primogenitus]|uniref:Uncharacterized protein n=1 Tax=Dacryopinax primogenitus (strain DJM 731) TaxID=1858805 RepID=M5FRL9_DACPD|nr:uncharacterized protein DACRYDRAFT_109242 [Dacryopinax primogenitus]EJT99815.1 hypothetical protein DACRYDRAFT_109242 [Dacryopinax primogenitus]
MSFDTVSRTRNCDVRCGRQERLEQRRNAAFTAFYRYTGSASRFATYGELEEKLRELRSAVRDLRCKVRETVDQMKALARDMESAMRGTAAQLQTGPAREVDGTEAPGGGAPILNPHSDRQESMMTTIERAPVADHPRAAVKGKWTDVNIRIHDH